MSDFSETPRFGVGHNSAPDEGRAWRRYAWGRARKALLGKHLPVEIVRTRMRRAAELGLAYPAYASVLRGSGRDIVGFLFTVDGMSLRLRRRLELPDEVAGRLRALKSCERLALSPPEELAEAFRIELSEVSGAPFAAAASAPEPGRWRDAREAIRAALAPLGAPGDAVVMIGASEEEARWAAAGRLAKFIPGEVYFTEGPGAC